MNAENRSTSSTSDAENTEGLDASPPASPDGGFVSDKGEAERGEVLQAMAVYSGDGQVDDASGGDVARSLAQPQEDSDAEPDRMPSGPS